MKFLTPPDIIALLKEYVNASEALISESTEGKESSEQAFQKLIASIDKLQEEALDAIKSREEQSLWLNLKELIVADYTTNLDNFISSYSLSDDELGTLSAGEIMSGTSYYRQQLKPILIQETHPTEWEAYKQADSDITARLEKAQTEFESSVDEFNEETKKGLDKSFAKAADLPTASDSFQEFVKILAEEIIPVATASISFSKASAGYEWSVPRLQLLLTNYSLNTAFRNVEVQDANRQIIIDNGKVEYSSKGFFPSLGETGEEGGSWSLYFSNMQAGEAMLKNSIENFMTLNDQQTEEIKEMISKSTDEGQVNEGLMPTSDSLRVMSKMALWSYRDITPLMEEAAKKGLTSISYSASAISIYTLHALIDRGYKVFQGPINEQTGLYESVIIDWSAPGDSENV